MEYAGFLIRRERMVRNWSQEGLCRGICTVSYLSKIEQGKVKASQEVLELLLDRMDARWIPVDGTQRAAVEDAYDALFGWERERLKEILDGLDEALVFSELGPDVLLLRQWGSGREPLDSTLESSLGSRQMAVQRMLQGRFEEAARLYPCGAVYFELGEMHYRLGAYAQALEALQRAYDLAAQEGRPWVMLHARLFMGNCYANQRRFDAMERHYRVARRLAQALGDGWALESMGYNQAATLLEAGAYGRALEYYESLDAPSRMELHKTAICYEGLGRRADALEALDRAEAATEREPVPQELDRAMRELVRYRLEHGDYLEEAAYGKLLMAVFEGCREGLPSGYAAFHLPWVLEWYEHHRMYKQAYELARAFAQTGP